MTQKSTIEASVGGHFDVRQIEDIEFTDFDTVFSAVAGSPAESMFREYIGLAKDVRIAIVRNADLESPLQRIFYSEIGVFQHYVMENQVPLMTIENQARFLIATPLPTAFDELYPETDSLLGLGDPPFGRNG